MTTEQLAAPDRPDGRRSPSRRRALPRGAAFWLVGAVLCVFLMAATVPSPMYAVYQQRWDFSATVLTAVFAVYGLAILISLLLFGSLSDHVGRRPVLLGAVVLEILSVVVLAAAPGVGWLYLGRVLQGLATGAVTSAASGALLDLQPPGKQLGALVNTVASSAGLALGAALAGVLVQFAPAPTVLGYLVILAALVLTFFGVVAMPESAGSGTVSLRRALRPQRPSVPAGRRGTFALLATSILASWTVGGMYLSLGPSLAREMVDGTPHLVGGLTITALTGTGAIVQSVLSGWPGIRAVRAGTPLLIAGLAALTWSVLAHLPVMFHASSVLLGIGWGLTFMGGFRMLAGLATPEHRAGTTAMIYVVAYLSMGVPAVAIGFLTTALGLLTATVVFGSAAALFAAVAGLSTLLHGSAPART
ncbi:putative MFS family arabinose efflux permease [Halopolyspora algeriensis]|uniref:Putative MFS family arabinose efflux permease n=1 Tax=Halopolyspora algeriensis TaxID=1500506 RepID=A0A368W0I3_9ACTN|nr:MFS transporter [Halopolyspora algeriensis]RCW47142.1 putative MFS family arabinose efflux permease [Halopolyspora algeriensis]TQM48229.1 putative MFS family arabinose efflux permease [Halopolyspora algeriensis]